jgi:hypothetical protein
MMPETRVAGKVADDLTGKDHLAAFSAALDPISPTAERLLSCRSTVRNRLFLDTTPPEVFFHATDTTVSSATRSIRRSLPVLTLVSLASRL